jgi:hypothetical protein
MPERIMPGLGLRSFYDPGQSDWGTSVSEDLRRLSALVQLAAKSRSTALPATGSAGDIHIVPPDAPSSANAIALWDGPAGAEGWVHLTPAAGWEAWIADAGERVRFDGTAWQVVLPGLAGKAGRLLGVNATEDALAFLPPPAEGAAEVLADGATTRMLTLADKGAIVEMTAGGANTVTIPAEASVAFPVGSLVNITQAGAGPTTIAAAAGVALNNVPAGSCTIDARWSGAALYKRGPNAWVVQGAISEVA